MSAINDLNINGRSVLGENFIGCRLTSSQDLKCKVAIDTPTHRLEDFVEVLANSLDDIEEDTLVKPDIIITRM